MAATRGGNIKKRRFQSTGFGLDRDLSCGDALPPWKQKSRNRVKRSVNKHLNALKQRLEQQKQRDSNLSPKSRKQNANQTINSFKQTLIENEMNFIKQSEPNTFFEDAKDDEFENERYKEIYAQLAEFLEQETELSDLTSSHIASLQVIDNNADAHNEVVDEYEASYNEQVPCCPLCCKGEIEIGYVQNVPCYECLCGAKFRPSDASMV